MRFFFFGLLAALSAGLQTPATAMPVPEGPQPFDLDFLELYHQAAEDGVEANRLIRRWEKVKVPGGKCGDGLDYSIFVSRGDPEKVAFDFMGGGACWSRSTCWGPNLRTWIHPLPTVLEPAGLVSPLPRLSPIHDYTIVYFPYCTGDVHIGTHVADYQGTPVHHVGARNVRTAVSRLTELTGVDLGAVRKFVLYGYSAGSLGALTHSRFINSFLPAGADKTLLADAPGLHWGKGFWDRFSDRWMRDIRSAMAEVGYSLRADETELAHLIPMVCSLLPDWRVGVLQGSRDLFMSKLFGKISPYWHERLVYGRQGVFHLTDYPGDNCSAWTPRSGTHTFLVTSLTARTKSQERVSAMDFARKLVGGAAGRNFR